MQCNFKVTGAVSGIIILILAIWPKLFDKEGTIANWTIIAMAVILILNSFMCKSSDAPTKGTRARLKKRR